MAGPASGFKMEAGSTQTHNVIGTIPSDAGYPLFGRLLPMTTAALVR